MKHWLAVLIGFTTCRFCGRAGRPVRFVGRACSACASDNLQWITEIGGVLTVPRGTRLPYSCAP